MSAPKIRNISEEKFMTPFCDAVIICCFLDMSGKICKPAKGNDRQSLFDSNVDF